jgi:hypothetical protein
MEPATIMALAGGIKALGGLGQAIFSGQKKAEKALGKEIEAIQFPSLLNIYAETKEDMEQLQSSLPFIKNKCKILRVLKQVD